MTTKLFRRFSVIAFPGFLALSTVVGVLLTEATLHPGRHALSSDDEIQASEMARLHNSELTDVAIAARDNVTLRAWNIRPKKTNGNAVILLHGLADNRAGMTGYAELLLSHGFSVLLPDARAHGMSGGDLATFGLLESDDIHRWLDWIEQNDQPLCVFGLGESMGAALLLQSLRSETRFCAVAAESPFASFREIGYERVGQFFRTGPWLGRSILRPIVEFAFAYARWKYNLDFEQLSPQDAVAATKIPVFLIHGQSDRNIPVRHSRLIAARNPAVLLWAVPYADHCGAVGTDPEEFSKKLIFWFESHADNKGILWPSTKAGYTEKGIT
jgi:alpha-beta hydrolase superfamily lysophospholipase